MKITLVLHLTFIRLLCRRIELPGITTSAISNIAGFIVLYVRERWVKMVFLVLIFNRDISEYNGVRNSVQSVYK
jgi:hypothetical protein